MEIVINNTYGGYKIPEEVFNQIETQGKYDDRLLIRANPIFVNWVKNHKTSLLVVYMPDEATDFMITEYDGMETFYYVLDGKIHIANYERR